MARNQIMNKSFLDICSPNFWDKDADIQGYKILPLASTVQRVYGGYDTKTKRE